MSGKKGNEPFTNVSSRLHSQFEDGESVRVFRVVETARMYVKLANLVPVSHTTELNADVEF